MHGMIYTHLPRNTSISKMCDPNVVKLCQAAKLYNGKQNLKENKSNLTIFIINKCVK